MVIGRCPAAAIDVGFGSASKVDPFLYVPEARRVPKIPMYRFEHDAFHPSSLAWSTNSDIGAPTYWPTRVAAWWQGYTRSGRGKRRLSDSYASRRFRRERYSIRFTIRRMAGMFVGFDLPPGIRSHAANIRNLENKCSLSQPFESWAGALPPDQRLAMTLFEGPSTAAW